MNKVLKPYQIKQWIIDPELGLATLDDEKVHLEPKSIELLNCLAENAGEVVSRSALLEAVWPGVIVGDEVITNTIAKLRKALRDDPRKPEMIETIPKRGYRIATPVIQIDSPDFAVPASPASRIPANRIMFAIFLILVFAGLLVIFPPGEENKNSLFIPEKPSVAVLPFTNLSDSKDQEYFVDGITEDLITDLSRVSGLFVIARNSSFSYKNKIIDTKEAGRDLGVSFIIEGSIRSIGDQLRINIQLIDVNTGGHIWSRRYDSSINDVFDLQQNITTEIIDALSVKMTASEKNHNSLKDTIQPAAYHAFLKGLAAYKKNTPEGFNEAISYLEIAIEEDPGYAHALATLGGIYWETYQKRWHRRLGISPLSAVWQKANEYIEKSMISPTPMAHKVSSSMLVTNRRFDEAVSEAKRAIDIDPNDPQGYDALANAYLYWGNTEQAEKLVNQAIRLDPKNPEQYMLISGNIRLMQKQFEAAIQIFIKITQKYPDNRLAWMALLSAYGSTNQTENSKTILEKLNALQKQDKLVKFTVTNAHEYWPFHDKKDLSFFLDGLRKAGTPEW